MVASCNARSALGGEGDHCLKGFAVGPTSERSEGVVPHWLSGVTVGFGRSLGSSVPVAEAPQGRQNPTLPTIQSTTLATAEKREAVES